MTTYDTNYIKMPRCKECAWYRPGGICKNTDVHNYGATCPIATAGPCFLAIGEPLPEKPITPYKEARIPRNQRRGRGANNRKVKPEDYNRTKVCICCGKTKPLTEFYRSARLKDGRARKCKECDRAAYRFRKQQRREAEKP